MVKKHLPELLPHPLNFDRQLQDEVCRFANVLRSSGVGQGDRVALYLPVSPLAVAAMLACSRIGAVHSVVFAGFSADALASRIQDGKFAMKCKCSNYVKQT